MAAFLPELSAAFSAFANLQSGSQAAALTQLTIIGGAICFLLNLAALGGIFFKIGKFEGRIETKLENIEQRQSVTVSHDAMTGARDRMDRMEEQIDLLRTEKISEHRVRSIVMEYADRLKQDAAKEHERGRPSRGRDL